QETADHVMAMEREVDELIEKIRQREHSTEALAAMLAAQSRREQSARQLATASVITTAMTEFGKGFADTMHELNDRVADFTAKTDAGTKSLARWTALLAAATFLLFLATAALVWATATIE